MTLSNSIFAVSGAATFLDARKDMSNLFACDTSMEPHPGLLTVGGSVSAAGNVVVGMNNRMAVTVRPFQAVLNRLGALLIMNDGDVVVSLKAAPSANSRIDVVYVKQRERRPPISDSEDGPIIGVVTGTANLTPVAPQVPDGAVALAQVKVTAGVTNTTANGVVITQVYPFAATRGEELRFRSRSDMEAFAATEGTRAVTIGDNAHYVRTNGAWNSVIYHHKEGNWEMWVNSISRTGMIVTSGNKLDGGSWASLKAPFTIPAYARPTRAIQSAAVTQNGGSTTAVLAINVEGEISLSNQGSAGSTNSLLASLTWVY